MKHLQNVTLLMLMMVVADLTGCMRRVSYLPGMPPPERALMEMGVEHLDFNDDLDMTSLILVIDHSIKYYDGAGRDRMFRVADRFIGA